MREYGTVAVTLAGKEEDCARFLQSLDHVPSAGRTRAPEFSLAAWIPMPPPLTAAAVRPEEPINEDARGALAADGAESLDDWRLRYWGSRSDAVDPEIVVHEDGTIIHILFGVPDRVPDKALQALAEAFPELVVAARIYCPAWPRSQDMVFRPTGRLEPQRLSA